MIFSALASGSSGNCFYIENNKTSILIDAGISSKQITERLSIIGKKPEKIKAIFLTHEHTDHIRGVDVFSRTFNVPVFATKKTIENSNLSQEIDEDLIRTIKNNESINLSGINIEAFSKSHKANDPVSYTVYGKKNISIITDAGYCCKNIIKAVKESNFLCIEANHDLNMLDNGPYPIYLKKWIKSDIGHLSNFQAAICLLEHSPSKLKNLILSHLSKTNNTPQIALKTFSSLLKERRDLSPKITLSLRENPTRLIEV